jgi:hypothetical protein
MCWYLSSDLVLRLLLEYHLGLDQIILRILQNNFLAHLVFLKEKFVRLHWTLCSQGLFQVYCPPLVCVGLSF